MPTFVYHAKTRQGGGDRGEVEAVDQSAAHRMLRQRDLFVTRLRRKPGGRVGWRTGHVPHKELVAVTYQLEALIKAGMPLARGLAMLASHASSPACRTVMGDVRRRVESGASLAAALRSHPGVFTPWYVGMVEAGEESGTLDDTFRRLAEHSEKVWRLTQQVKLALAYPLLVASVAVLVLWVLLMWVIPMFSGMFADWGNALPWPTAVVVAASQWFGAYWLPILVGAVGVGLGMRRWAATTTGRRVVEACVCRVPLLGTLWRNVAVVHVARTLGSLLGSGVPLVRSLEIAGHVSGLRRMTRALADATSSVREGQTLADPLERSGVFPALVPGMVAVGEASGGLDTAFDKIADLYEREVDRDVAALTAMLEPLIIVALGLGIGFVVVAMYLPIFMMGSMFE